MDVSITKFRRDLFRLADSALKGEPVSFVHRGVRLKVLPETKVHNLEQITPLQVINPKFQHLDTGGLQEEMKREWRQDWAEL